MKKRVLPFLCLLFLCVGMLCPPSVEAVTPLDTTAQTSLTLHYKREGTAFPGLSVGIYRVAEAFADGTFELIEPFSGYPVNIHDITRQDQWLTAAGTLHAYAVADQLQPDGIATTDKTGVARFEGLATGLYLVQQVVAEDNSGKYLFNHFLIYLPTPRPDGTFLYDVEANPKCVYYVPKSEYRVTKLWQDSGKEGDRPKSVTVDIYKDGQLQESQTLNAANNWSYVWYVPADADGQWTVAEQSVAEAYTVTIRENGGSFSIINTLRGETPTPDIPQTGDTFSPMPWILVLCLSGCVLLILGIYGRRRR